MTQEIERLNADIISTHLNTEYRARLDQLILLDEITSTNDFLLAKASSHQVLACFAEHQTRGKGSHQRHWVSPRGQNIYHSLLWHFNTEPATLMGLSLAVAIMVIRALKDYGIDTGISVKWPNDIFFTHRKLAGILTEIAPKSSSQLCSVVIGVGLNTHLNLEQTELIDQPWSCIEEITSQPVNRNQLAGLLLNHLIIGLAAFAHEGLAAFVEEWQQFDYLCGKPITVISTGQEISGTMIGISERGELILLDREQQVHYYLNGEIVLKLDKNNRV